MNDIVILNEMNDLIIDDRFPEWGFNIEEGIIYSFITNRPIGSLKNKNTENTYLLVSNNKYGHRGIHQYIWMVANKCDIPNGYHIHHIDGNKQNNSIYNLELIEAHKHLSEHNIGHKNNLGKHHTEETKNKISNTKRNIPNIKSRKKVAQLTLDGELIKIWDSMTDAENSGFSASGISQCCRGKKNTHKKFKWIYYEK